MSTEQFETVAEFLLETEADLARMALAERSIEAFVHGRPLFGTGVLSMGGKDAFKLKVPAGRLAEARAILARIDNGSAQIPTESEPQP